MLLILFHEKYQGLNVVLSDFRGLEKYCQYCDNHWKQGWWEDKQRNPATVTTGKEKYRKILFTWKLSGLNERNARSLVLRLRYGVLPLAQFCYISKMHVSKFGPCKWRLKSWKDSRPEVSFNCFYRCRYPSCCKISLQFSL